MERKNCEQSIRWKHLEIIDYLLQHIDGGFIEDISKKLGVKYHNTHNKLMELCLTKNTDILICVRKRKTEKRKTESFYFCINGRMDFERFIDVAQWYLKDEKLKERYERDKNNRKTIVTELDYMKTKKLLFLKIMERTNMERFIDNAGTYLNIPFPKRYTEEIFPILFAHFPSALSEVVFHINRIYMDLEKEGKKLTKADERQMFLRFLTFLQINIFHDLRENQYLEPKWWCSIDVSTSTEIYLEHEKFIDELSLGDLKRLCRESKMKVSKYATPQELIENLQKKLNKKKVIVMDKKPLLMGSRYEHIFKDY